MRRASLIVAVLTLMSCSAELAPIPSTLPTTATTEPETTTSSAPTTTTTTMATTTTTLAPLDALTYEVVADMPFPIHLTAVPGSDLSYVATKDGRIWLYDGETVLSQPVLDISGQVRDEGERGLLAIEISQDLDGTGRLWAHYSAGDGDTVVSEFTFVDETTLDPASERVLLRLDQPASNHNGGMLLLAEDGLLYLGLGDGGGANDQFGNGQNTGTLLGALVTLSPTGDPAPTLFQYGLRNPWRFWIDDDLIYIADVGQGSFEEVSVGPLTEGTNYGWPITEGLHCFRPSSGCDTTGLTLPVVEVSHGDAGTCSITGGIVYRGPSVPEVDGHFFYSDLCGGYLRSFRFEGGAVVDPTDWTDQVGVPGRVVSFGQDGAGEMYVMTTEQLLKVVPVRG